MFEDAVCLAFQTSMLQGRSILRVARAQPSVCSLRRRVRLDAKNWAPNPTLQAQKVLLVKWGLTNSSLLVDTTTEQKLQSIFAEPLSDSKHEAFKVLFPNGAFLDDFVSEVDGLLP
jgi:hypothetical protein